MYHAQIDRLYLIKTKYVQIRITNIPNVIYGEI